MVNNGTDGNGLIKVHVTQTQREYLEFLVTRRLNDIRRFRGGIEKVTEEEKQLQALKYELSQAGT